VQLAGDAQSVVAMTDHEKKRVEELLADLDSLPEIPEENSVDEVSIQTRTVELSLEQRLTDGMPYHYQTDSAKAQIKKIVVLLHCTGQPMLAGTPG